MPHLPGYLLTPPVFGIYANVTFNYHVCPIFATQILRFCDIFGYPASRGFSLVWLLELTKSFASLVSRVVDLFYTPQFLTGHKQNQLRDDKPCERLRKR